MIFASLVNLSATALPLHFTWVKESQSGILNDQYEVKYQCNI